MKKITGNKKGIDTILAALLMVVIVVVAAVMVYAWSTGLLGTLLVKPNTGEGPLSPDNTAFSNSTSATITIRNAGTSNVTLIAYYVTDSNGNQWTKQSWTGPTISPNKATNTIFVIGASCPSGCTYQGATGGFSSLPSGHSHTLKIVTQKKKTLTLSH